VINHKNNDLADAQRVAIFAMKGRELLYAKILHCDRSDCSGLFICGKTNRESGQNISTANDPISRVQISTTHPSPDIGQ